MCDRRTGWAVERRNEGGMRKCLSVLMIVPLMMWACSLANSSSNSNAQPPARVPSNVAWTTETVLEASEGDALRGLLLAKRCDHCHGNEGFSANANIPNLAGLGRLAFWKEMEDFASGKRNSSVMSGIAAPLTRKDFADLAAYYSMLPTSTDPLDRQVFPQTAIPATQSGPASRLIVLGDARRGIPPCQACHGPVGFKTGAPPLVTQNGDYVLAQLRDFATGARANDINMPMRSIAGVLTEEERQALAGYYGSGLGRLPAGAVFSK
jgi:cytochrome c553